MSTPTNCPDRTARYLLDLQTKYRNDTIPSQKIVPGSNFEIVPSNPFRVMLSFSIIATGRADIYFVTSDGQLVFYTTSTTPFNVTVNQQQQYILPTLQWIVNAANNDDLTGMAVVKV